MNPMRLVFAQVLTAVMVVAGLLVRFHYDWPDYVHTDYGFPLVWATTTTSTIAGPAEIWQLNLANMAVDVAFWAILSVIVATMIDVLKRRRQPVQDRLGSA